MKVVGFACFACFAGFAGVADSFCVGPEPGRNKTKIVEGKEEKEKQKLVVCGRH